MVVCTVYSLFQGWFQSLSSLAILDAMFLNPMEVPEKKRVKTSLFTNYII